MCVVILKCLCWSVLKDIGVNVRDCVGLSDYEIDIVGENMCLYKKRKSCGCLVNIYVLKMSEIGFWSWS